MVTSCVFWVPLAFPVRMPITQTVRKTKIETRAAPPLLRAAMSEDVVRQTRSQKRALERDSLPGDADSKKTKLDKGELARSEITAVDGLRVPNILKAGEVKATIKVEVQSGDEPVDMSTTKSDLEKRPPSPDDVIVLSDNEPSSPQMNGLNHCSKELDTDFLMKSSPAERERIIKQLKEELRLEEAKLVLLKKLRQSQIQKENPVQKTVGSSSSVATPPPLVRGTIVAGKGTLQMASGHNSGTVIPPPLVRGGQQVSSKLGSQNAQIVMPPLVRGAQVSTCYTGWVRAVTMAYVNPSLSVHKTSSTVDRQREYLLDMLPSRSISQTANTWK
ncbi:transcriptional repressor p66-alpha-like isoform X1 [Arapaima gigas]